MYGAANLFNIAHPCKNLPALFQIGKYEKLHSAWMVFGHYLSEAANRRSRWGSVRGWPVLSSHFSPGFAPHVGQRTSRASFFLALMSA
jgi:hypothetical protein